MVGRLPRRRQRHNLGLPVLDEVHDLELSRWPAVQPLERVAVGGELKVPVGICLAHGRRRGLELDDHVLVLDQIDETLQVQVETLAGRRVHERHRERYLRAQPALGRVLKVERQHLATENRESFGLVGVAEQHVAVHLLAVPVGVEV